jgi:(1->4)-alpha-D-glucan 1-alpha-D-glucosylmutase
LHELQSCDKQSRRRSKERPHELVQNADDGRIKLYVIWKTLAFRNRNADLFRDGEYLPLQTSGEHANHVVAFARRADNRNGVDPEVAIVAVPRLLAKVVKNDAHLLVGNDVWSDTRIQLRANLGTRFRNLFTGEVLEAQKSGPALELPAAQMFADFPIALLVPTEDPID